MQSQLGAMKQARFLIMPTNCVLLERYHVHISGHHHAYFPGHRGQLELLHTGALGSGPRPLLNSNLAPQKP